MPASAELSGNESGADLTMPGSDDDASSTSSSTPHQQLGSGLTSRRDRSLPRLKEPWIPAPALTSKTYQPRDFYGDQSHQTAKIVNANDTGQSKPSNRRSRRSRSSGKERLQLNRNISETMLTTTDSLIDVSECLNKRREEILQLWGENLQDADAILLNEFGIANQLSMEVSKDVTELNNAIDNLKKEQNPTVSYEQTKGLECLRNRILSKLQLFEASYEVIHKRIQAFKNTTSVAHPDKSRESISHKSPKTMSQPLQSNRKSSLKASSEFQACPTQIRTTLDKKKSTTFVERIKFEESDGDKLVPSVAAHIPARPKEDLNRPYSHFMNNSELYSLEKIRNLQKKISDQEEKSKEVEREVKELKSQNQYDINRLKTNFKAQLDDISQFPTELLEVAEGRLNESLRARFAIEANLQIKAYEVNSLRDEVSRIFKDLDRAESKLNTSESKNEVLIDKIEFLQNENKELRAQIANQSQTIVAFEQKQVVIDGFNEACPKKSESQRILMLEDKIFELEQELEKVNKESNGLRTAKNDASRRLHRQIEELTDDLESTRARNRTLRNQIQYIKTRYFELFPLPPGYGKFISTNDSGGGDTSQKFHDYEGT